MIFPGWKLSREAAIEPVGNLKARKVKAATKAKRKEILMRDCLNCLCFCMDFIRGAKVLRIYYIRKEKKAQAR